MTDNEKRAHDLAVTYLKDYAIGEAEKRGDTTYHLVELYHKLYLQFLKEINRIIAE
jgi:hypothetical protein